MYAGMPVKTAIKSRVIFPGFYGQRTIGKSNTCLVWEFPLHTPQRELRKMRGAFDGQFISAIFQFELWIVLCNGTQCIKQDRHSRKRVFTKSMGHFWSIISVKYGKNLLV